jgi:hypothetical protein
MRKPFTRFAIIAGALLAGTSPVAAAQITYTLTGNGFALLGNSVVSGPFAFVGVGENTPDLEADPDVTIFLMDSVTLAFGGSTVSATNPMYFIHGTLTGTAGFFQLRPGPVAGFVAGGNSNVLKPYDPATAIGPVPVTFAGFDATFDTSGGVFLWQGTPTNMTFQAELDGKVTGAVPEPATWGLMIAGFGVAGAALRRKPKVAVSFG